MRTTKNNIPPLDLPNVALILDSGQLGLIVTPTEFKQARRRGRTGLHLILLTPQEQKIAFNSLRAGGDDAQAMLAVRVCGGAK